MKIAFALARLLLVLSTVTAVAPAVQAQAAAPPGALVFENVRIFSGRSERLSPPSHVLVVGNVITSIATEPLADPPGMAVTRIAGQGRTLMPGLIDAHGHIMLDSIPLMAGLTADIGYVTLVAAKSAERHLMRGFTSVRDMGGPAFSLKRAIDQGLFPGPRIFASGATISQTGGHGDFMMPTDTPRQIGGPLSYLERNHVTIIADGADQVLMRAREQLRLGASQIKLMAGGGVASAYDPLDVAQFTEAEFRAAVDAADNWGTYVAVHAYTPRAIQTALKAGVKSIDHGQMIDEPTARLIGEKGAWLSMQPFLDDEDANPTTGESRKKQIEMSAGTDTAYRLAKKYKLKLAFGTDALFDAQLATRQGKQLAKLTRWFTPAEVLKMATADNAQLLALSGPRNPYPGALGVVQAGALADLLLVDGDPLENIQLIADPDKNFVVIVKDGVVVKNRLAQ